MTRKTERKTVYLILVPGMALAVAYVLGIADTGSQLFLGLATATGLAAGYELFVKRKIHEKYLNSQNIGGGDNPLKGNLSSTEALEKAKDWADKHYKSSSFNIDFSKDEMHSTLEYDLNVNQYEFFAFKSTYGDGKSVIVFVDATSKKEVVEHITVKYRDPRSGDARNVEDLDEWKNPFDYCERVKSLRNKTRWKLYSEGTANMNRTGQQVVRGGMAVDADYNNILDKNE